MLCIPFKIILILSLPVILYTFSAFRCRVVISAPNKLATICPGLHRIFSGSGTTCSMCSEKLSNI